MPPSGSVPFILERNPLIRGEGWGDGPAVVLCHGLTATRNQVLHGSRVLERAGHRVLAYDARGHGESDPAPAGQDYGYEEMVGDLESVVAVSVGEGPIVVVGHSMGSHTALAYTLRHPGRVAGLVVIGPVYSGEITAETIAFWDGLAAALEQEGIDGFIDYIGRHQGIDPAWRDTVLRFTRARMLLHRHLGAVVEALRGVPRSRPFESLQKLEAIGSPTLVVASHDGADPGHPFALAAAYASHLPAARLISEGEGESPLAWQGGKLSRAIAAFCAEPEVAGRFD